MLQSIRERAHGWFAWVLFSLISITFIFWGVQSYTGGGTSDTAATVNGTDIRQGELQSVYERLRAQQQFQLGTNSIPTDLEKQLKQQALQDLVISSVLSQSAITDGLRFTLEQAISNIRLMPTFQINAQFSADRFKQVLASLNYSEQQFIANLQSAMLINQMRVGFMNSAFALPSEVEDALRLIKQRRNVQYLIIPVKQLSGKVVVSAPEIQAYYEQHQKDYQLPEQVSIEYIELSLDRLKSSLHFNDEQLKQFYNANSALFTKQGALLPFDKAKQQVAQTMLQQKAEQLYAEQVEKLANLTFSNASSLTPAAKAFNLSIQETGLFDNKGAKAGIAANPKVVAAAFSAEVLKQDNNSAVLELDPQHAVVIRIKAHKPASTLPFDSVKQGIIEKLQLQKAGEMASMIGADILNQFNQGKNINAALKQYQLTWVKKDNIGRYDSNIPSQILAKAFQLPLSSDKQHYASGLSLATNDFALVLTDKIYEGNTNKPTPAELRVFKEQLENLYGQFDYGLYVDSVFKKAKVKIKI